MFWVQFFIMFIGIFFVVMNWRENEVLALKAKLEEKEQKIIENNKLFKNTIRQLLNSTIVTNKDSARKTLDNVKEYLYDFNTKK
jgi:hypothetical protein